jgi:hypothetical protein
MSCGCGGGQPSAVDGRRVGGLLPVNRWRGGAVVYEGSVGPELEIIRKASTDAFTGGLAGRVSQSLNGVRARRTTRDLPTPVAFAPHPMGGVQITPVGVEMGPSSATGLPPGWYPAWSGESGEPGAPGVV